MDKFKELSFEEMQEVDGGDFSLWSPSIALLDFTIGIMETYADAVVKYHNQFKYQN